MAGSSPCLVSRRRSASAAERYCVGSTPKPRNTLRQAASVGSSERGVLSEALADGQLLGPEGGREIGRCRGIVHVRGVDDTPDDTGKAASHAWVVVKARHVPSLPAAACPRDLRAHP